MSELLSGDGVTTIAVVVGLPLLLLVAVLFATMLLSRRHHGREIREIVTAVEELRSGTLRHRPDVDPGSPLAMISDAVHRLGQDVGLRMREADGARVRLDAVMDSARDLAVVATDPDGDIHSFSPGAVAMFGWAQEVIAGQPVSSLFDAESWEEFLPKLGRRSLGGEGVETAATLQRQDGTRFEAQLGARAIPGPSGDPAGFLLVVRDTSDTLRLERELHDSKHRYRALLDELGEGVFIQQGGVLVYSNRALAALCGADDSEMQGAAIRDHVAGREVLLVQDALASVESGARERVELQVHMRRGVRQGRIRAARIEYGDGAAVLGSIEDVTAETRIEAELRRNESRLDAVLESIQDGILVIGQAPQGSIVQMTNHGFAELFDLDPVQVLGAREEVLFDLLRHRGAAGIEVADLLSEASATPRAASVSLPGGDGGELEVLVAALQDRAGRRLGRILVCGDRSTRRRLQAQVEALQEELIQTRHDLDLASEKATALREDYEARLEQGERIDRELRALAGMKDNLLGTVAHDLQMPLVAVRGYNEVLRQGRLGPVNEEQGKGLDEALRHIDRMRSMIDSLLTIPRMSREAGRLELSDFPLSAPIDAVLGTLRDALHARGVTVSVALEPHDLGVHADAERVERVFENLLSNAIKYNRDGGSIEVAARRASDERVEVQVRDTGIGIREDQLERIFEPHVRADEGERGPVEGHGLGLASVRETLWLHGCSIKVQSRLGQGSTFTFTLPLAVGDEKQPAPPAREAAKEAEPSAEPPAREEATAEAPPSRPRLKIIRPSDD
jgi:protein-histidine pros-kinase